MVEAHPYFWWCYLQACHQVLMGEDEGWSTALVRSGLKDGGY